MYTVVGPPRQVITENIICDTSIEKLLIVKMAGAWWFPRLLKVSDQNGSYPDLRQRAPHFLLQRRVNSAAIRSCAAASRSRACPAATGIMSPRPIGDEPVPVVVNAKGRK